MVQNLYGQIKNLLFEFLSRVSERFNVFFDQSFHFQLDQNHVSNLLSGADPNVRELTPEDGYDSNQPVIYNKYSSESKTGSSSIFCLFAHSINRSCRVHLPWYLAERIQLDWKNSVSESFFISNQQLSIDKRHADSKTQPTIER